jgi:hypothetical protein
VDGGGVDGGGVDGGGVDGDTEGRAFQPSVTSVPPTRDAPLQNDTDPGARPGPARLCIDGRVHPVPASLYSLIRFFPVHP